MLIEILPNKKGTTSVAFQCPVRHPTLPSITYSARSSSKTNNFNQPTNQSCLTFLFIFWLQFPHFWKIRVTYGVSVKYSGPYYYWRVTKTKPPNSVLNFHYIHLMIARVVSEWWSSVNIIHILLTIYFISCSQSVLDLKQQLSPSNI